MQRDAALAELERIRGAYARLIEQDTEQGRTVCAVVEHSLQQRAAFLSEAERQTTVLAEELERDLAEIDRVAGEAVAAKRPLWFTGGIPERLAVIDEKLALHGVLDPSGNAKLGADVDAMRASIAERARSLAEEIIRENPLPADRYAGADREAVVAVAKDAWSVQEPGYELLAVRIPAEAFARETKWVYGNGAWTLVDVSSLQVRLVVADRANPTLAIDRPVTVKRDHQRGDRMIGVPLDDGEEALAPNAYLLYSRIQ